jgi:hypothetical protein
MMQLITRALLSSALQCQVVDGAADAERAEQGVEARTCSMTDDDACCWRRRSCDHEEMCGGGVCE